MKKAFILFSFLFLTIFFTGCSKNKKEDKDELYFDYMGISEVSHIAYTSESSFDLKTIFKVGDRRSGYNNKKIGTTTYDDVLYYIYESYSQTEYKNEDENIKINNDGTVLRKKLCTAVIYAKLKEEPKDLSEDDKANGGMHVLTLYFTNEQTFGNWYGENNYLESWLKDGEKLATMTFKLNEDFSYTLTVTEGMWSTGTFTGKISSQIITGHLYGSCSSGAVRDDDNSSINYDISFEMNKYSFGEEEKYTLFTQYSFEENIYSTIRFLTKA
ncbi:MAG: hypothetical protein K6E87_01265 [bacterium]|nr:hypothetical protein [bacterium]